MGLMAIWQFDFYLGKRKSDVWNTEERFKKPIRDISSILKRTKGWSKNIDFYGDNDETCIAIIREEKKIVDIKVRLDLRALKQEEFEAILNFIKSMECEYLIVSDKEILVDKNTIINEILQSKQYAFVKDPCMFFENLQE